MSAGRIEPKRDCVSYLICMVGIDWRPNHCIGCTQYKSKNAKLEKRMEKDEYFLNIARAVALRCTCTRRKAGAILVDENGVIVSTGYNGSVRGTLNCGKDCECLKDKYKEPSLKSYDYCPAVHAEMNAIINAARSGVSTVGTTMYYNQSDNKGYSPCYLCRRMIIQAGIVKFVYYSSNDVLSEGSDIWLKVEKMWFNKMLTDKPKEER